MSLKVDRTTSSGYDEPTLKWAHQLENGWRIDDDSDSISSEDESGSIYDGEQQYRLKPVLEIWQDEQIWKQLQCLPGAEEIAELIELDTEKSLEEISTRKDYFRTSILLASWLGNEKLLEKLLDHGASPHFEDEDGRTALHLAAYSGDVNCVKMLLDHGANVHAWDKKRKYTPLHCAASKGHLQSIRALLKYGADVNAGLSQKSALHYAVQSLAIDCVKELLENNAIPNSSQVFSETPLHVAASLNSSQIIKLLLKYGAAVNVQCGAQKLTPLHLAAEDGCPICTGLLIEAGADLAATNHKNQTPLHLAALSQASEAMELLLSKGADPNATDADGRTPLHCAIVKVSRSCECVKLLLNSGADVNKPDSFGYTALHLAALNEFSHLLMVLINHGGDVTSRTNGGISVLTFITRKTPDVIPKYINKFDSSIKINDHEIGDVDCELKLDFRVLVPTMGNKETELLLNFIEVGHKEVLKHPLCETFMYLKWRRIRKFFLLSFVYHILFVLLFTIYVQGVYLRDCPPRSKGKAIQDVCVAQDYVNVIGYMLLFLNVTLLVKELYQVAQSWCIYIKQWENWLEWIIIGCVFCCVQPTSSDIRGSIAVWQHHIAAYGIFLSWVELMMIVGRFPIFGLYVQMFTTVSYNFTKFVMAYFCLLVAFGLSFQVIFANYKAFAPFVTMLKVIVMMSGELEYEDIFYDADAPIIYSVTAQFMFLLFTVLVAIVLNNLMVGLAVSDIQGLQQSAGLDRLVRQVELVAHIEQMLFSKLLSCIPHKLLHFLHKHALLLKSQYHWALYIKPNDPREERIPKDLIASIYQLVVQKKDRPRSKKRKERFKSESEAISPALSRFNSYNSGPKEPPKQQQNIKVQFQQINKEFVEFARDFKQKLEYLNNQIMNTK